MKRHSILACLTLLMLSLAFATTAVGAEAKVVGKTTPTSPNTGFITVPLDVYVNDAVSTTFTTRYVTVNGVPFQLADSRNMNALSLKSAGWSDWEKDPSSYYSDYDGLPKNMDPARFIFHVPVADYASVALLAVAEDSEEFSQVVSFRIGAIDRAVQTTYHDYSGIVPRFGEAPGRTPFMPVEGGNLFLVEVPLAEALAQDFGNRIAFDVDVTKELRLAIRRPDPCRYRVRPLGLPSGVRILGMTFRRSTIEMATVGTEPGNVFNEPQIPAFRINLTKTSTRRMAPCVIEATATDAYGETVNVTTEEITFERNDPDATALLEIPVKTRGYYDLDIRLKSGRNLILTRRTSFALLPPDTRKYRAESPFGTWDFTGGHFSPSDPDLLGPLYVKAGLRYGMFSQPQEILEKYGIKKGNDIKVAAKTLAALKEKLDADPSLPLPERLMIFHETAISGGHISRVPDIFTGRPPYVLDEKEQARFDQLWTEAEEAAKSAHEAYPKAEIYFGNGAPQLLEAFARRKFPAELMGSRGNEAGNFMRMPETQPPDFVANNAGLWMDRTILDHYGYTHTPLRQCYEMCYPNTNPGNLSERTQADYYVRHMMHSLAWRVPVIRACIITDVGNSYYFSNWGAAGLCHGLPHVRPKPSYVACATMTLMLDGTTFTRFVETGSPVVYAAEFKRRDKKTVSCLWTLRGTREVTIETPSPQKLVATDLMANEAASQVEGDRLRLTVSSSPVFLTTPKPIVAIACGQATMMGRPEGKTFAISSLDSMEGWVLEKERDTELEVYEFDCPKRKGNFDFTALEAFEGESNVLKVTPLVPVEGERYLPMYSVLQHSTGVEIPDVPTEIGLMVNGNGGWGRIIFALEDASGQRWISIGAEQKGQPTRWMADWLTPEQFAELRTSGTGDWNTGDPWERSSINFEGWRYVQFPLPGNYPGEGYHWPYSSQWRYDGDGVVHYPLKFKRLVVTLRENVLHLTDYRPVARPEIYLRDLMVSYRPPEEAFRAE